MTGLSKLLLAGFLSIVVSGAYFASSDHFTDAVTTSTAFSSGITAPEKAVADSDTGSSTTTPNILPTQTGMVSRVIDGDTLELVGGEKIRLLLVDTPEVHSDKECYGPEASALTKQLVPQGTQVDLTYDKQRFDRYGRTLAYVSKHGTGESVNAELIRKGYASLLVIKPNVARQVEYAALEAEAKAERRGLWGAC